MKNNKSFTAESFCEIYGQYKDQLYRYALYKLSDPTLAEDAVSECVLAAWKDIEKLRSADAFGAWIFAILRNVCNGQLRRIVSDRDNTAQSLTVGNAEVSDLRTAPENTQQSIEIAEALAVLKEDECEIVLMSVVSGLNSNEIAEITGLKSGAVRSKLSRSLSKMRDFLEAR